MREEKGSLRAHPVPGRRGWSRKEVWLGGEEPEQRTGKAGGRGRPPRSGGQEEVSCRVGGQAEDSPWRVSGSKKLSEEPLRGVLGGSGRSHLHLEQLSWLLCAGWPRAVSGCSRSVRSMKCEKDPTLPSGQTSAFSGSGGRRESRWSLIGDGAVVPLGGESSLDRNGGTRRDLGQVLEIKVTRFGNSFPCG